MAGTGLVGIVTEVGPNWARVRSIIDDSSNVSALILSTSDKCIVKGDLTLMNDGKIRFEQLANNGSEIKEGEQVVTSHISSKYLQGILIGYVSEITTDANNLTRPERKPTNIPSFLPRMNPNADVITIKRFGVMDANAIF